MWVCTNGGLPEAALGKLDTISPSLFVLLCVISTQLTKIFFLCLSKAGVVSVKLTPATFSPMVFKL